VEGKGGKRRREWKSGRSNVAIVPKDEEKNLRGTGVNAAREKTSGGCVARPSTLKRKNTATKNKEGHLTTNRRHWTKNVHDVTRGAVKCQPKVSGATGDMNEGKRIPGRVGPLGGWGKKIQNGSREKDKGYSRETLRRRQKTSTVACPRRMVSLASHLPKACGLGGKEWIKRKEDTVQQKKRERVTSKADRGHGGQW